MKTQSADIDLNFWAILGVSGLLLMFLIPRIFAKEVCPIRLNNAAVARVPISLRGTVLSFPVKPNEVILGKAGSFGLKFIESDIAVSPLSPTARSNLFVYLQARRFSFDLVTDTSSGCSVVTVRDALESQATIDWSK